jgi:CDP-diacylglycerol--glycerol-3-phosphate 3-phosphatidyltransferase
MNGPNLLTLLRIFFVPLLVAALLGAGFIDSYLASWLGPWAVSSETFALAIFLVAAATDLLDGYLARRWGQITTVGTLLDPIADKLLISAALVSLVDIHRVPAWMVILIIGREFAVSGLRSIAAAAGSTIEASELGKTKMVAQVAAIALVIAGIRWPQLNTLAMIAMWAVVLFALVSAADYFRKFWGTVDSHVKSRRRRELLAMQRQQRKLRRAGVAASAKAVGKG